MALDARIHFLPRIAVIRLLRSPSEKGASTVKPARQEEASQEITMNSS